MSKQLIANVLRIEAALTIVEAARVTNVLIDQLARALKQDGRLAIPTFGSFVVRKTAARNGFNPKTGTNVHIKAGKTVRFKVSPTLKKYVTKRGQ